MGTRGGVFNLMVQDSKADKLLTATDVLNRRIARIIAEKRKLQKSGLYPADKSVYPTLAEIEETHMVHTQSIYKPYVALSFEYQRVLPDGAMPKFGESVRFELPTTADYISDIAMYVRMPEMGNPNDVRGNPNFNFQTANRYRYCELPGIRYIKHCQLTINNNPIAEYTDNDAVIHFKTHVPEEKRRGYDRNIGQEVSGEAKYYHESAQVNEVRFIKDGPQTEKSYQPALEMFIPLVFWFCGNKKQPLNVSSLPWGERYVTIKTAPRDEIVQAKNAAGERITFPFPKFNPEKVELYVNYMFVNPEVSDILRSRMDFQLIRVHRSFSQIVTTTASEQVNLNTLKWPTETIFFGFRPLSNFESEESFDIWHRYASCSGVEVCTPAIFPIVPPAPNVNKQLVSRPLKYCNFKSPVSDVSMASNGIQLYPLAPMQLFNSYLPATFGKSDDIRTPDDPGLGMMFFNTQPGKYQPTGQIMLSRLREMAIQYDGGSDISDERPVQIVASAIALNFLYSGNGSAVLRYST